MITYPQKTNLIKYIKDVVLYKDLLVLLSKKWIKSKYEHSYIGLGWIIVNPLITTIVYTIFFGMVFKIGFTSSQYFLFIYSGILPWVFFRDVFLEILDIFPKEPNIIKRTNFPRIILPLSVVLLKFVEFVFGLTIILLVAFASGRHLVNAHLLLLPLIIVEVVLISVGLGLVMLLPCIIYRDIKHLLRFIVPLGIYALPIVYKLKAVSPQWLAIYTLNPMVSVIQGFRSVLFQESIQWHLLIKGMSISVFIFVIGVGIFIRYEKRLPDYI